MNENSKSPKPDFESTSVFGHPIRIKEFDQHVQTRQMEQLNKAKQNKTKAKSSHCPEIQNKILLIKKKYKLFY